MPKTTSKTKEDPEEIKKIYVNEFNHQLDKLVKRALTLPVSYTLNAPVNYLGEATQAFYTSQKVNVLV